MILRKLNEKIIAILIFLLFSCTGFCQIGQVMSFDGVDDRAVVYSDTELALIDKVTIEVWVKIDEYDNDHVVYRGIDDFSIESYKIGILSGIPELRLRGSTPQVSVLSANTALTINQWHHIAATYDGSQAKIYIDGVLANSDFFSFPLLDSPGGQVYIGIDRDPPNNYNQAFTGCMDEVRIWSVARTQQEILADMNIPLTGNEPNLSLYFDMETVGPALIDGSNNINNAALEGSGGSTNGPQFNPENIVITSPSLTYEICENETIQFDISGATSYEWFPGSLVDDPFVANPTTSPVTTDTEFLVVGRNRCSEPDSIYIQVKVNLSSAETLTLEVCSGETITYNGQELNIGDTPSFVFQNENGCDSIINVIVNEDDQIEITDNIMACVGDEILIHGNLESLPGTYTTILPSSNSCDTIYNVILTNYPTINITLNENIPCSNNDGVINATITGGNPPYMFFWNDPNNSTSNPITGLVSGSYSVTVTDANGCNNTSSIVLSNVSSLDIMVDGIIMPSCFDSNDGSANILASGGTPPYFYIWDNGETNSIATALDGNIHYVTITDSNACAFVSSVNLIAPNEINPNINILANVSCFNEINGSATVSASGGTPPFSFLWDNGETTSIASMLSAGNHTVTVTDDNACISTASVIIIEPEALTTMVDYSPYICDDLLGSASIGVQNATNPISYLWSTGATQSSVSNLSIGNYSVTVTDANGCTTNESFTIENFESFIPTLEIQNITCFGDSSGVIIITELGEEVLFSLDSINFYDTNVFENLTAGSYDLFYQNATGCTGQIPFNILQNSSFNVTLPADTSIYIGNSVTIISSVDGGEPPFNYNYSPEETLNCTNCPNPIASPCVDMNYLLTVEDSNGCISQDEISITILDECNVGVPNVFSPNGDGLNDMFSPLSECTFVNYELTIFSRWGEIVFSTKEPDTGWNGIFKNKPLPSDVYVYLFSYNFKGMEKELLYGDITLLR